MALRRGVRRERAFELSPKAIREVEFRERVRGYDPAQVDPLLDELADLVAELQSAVAAGEQSESEPRPEPEADPAAFERAVGVVAALLHLQASYARATEILGNARRRARDIEHDARVERRRLLRESETV